MDACRTSVLTCIAITDMGAYRVRLHLVLKISMKLCFTPAKSCSHRTCRLVAYKEVHLPVVSSLKIVLKRVDRWCINFILGETVPSVYDSL